MAKFKYPRKQLVIDMENKEQEPEKVDFEAWYAVRKRVIPAIHHKEILQVHFKALGKVGEHTMETWDSALVQYGVRI